jgi:hypothetical protein
MLLKSAGSITMKLDPIALLTLIAGAIPVGAVGAFFLYVSPLIILSVAAGVIAILLLAGVKIVWGRHLRRSLRRTAPQPIELSRVVEVHLRFPAA